MEHTEGKFTGFGNSELYYQVWRPTAVPKATLVIAHGLGEHSGRYQNIVQALLPQGYVIYALDHRGHGRSPGQRGGIHQWADVRQDLRAFVQLAQSREAGRPFFLMGHSMGGCMVLEYVLHYPDGLTAVVASAPAVGPLNISPVLATLSKALARILPNVAVRSGLDITAVSRDTAVVEAYRQDPLVHDKGTPAAAVAFMQAAAWTMAHAADFPRPLLLLHGDADRLVDVARSQQFFAQVQHPDKKLIVYPGGYHELHNDLDQAQMLADLSEWLAAHQ